MTSLLLSTSLLACSAAHDPSDASTSSADAMQDVWRYDAGPIAPTDAVDILLVIDDRVGPEARDFRAEAGIVVEYLIAALTTGDRDADGTVDGPPTGSLHVAIVTGDLGAGPVTDAISCPAGRGRDGLLVTDSASLEADCMPTNPAVWSFPDPVSARDAVGVYCVASGVPEQGCAFQQPFEAALQAISPPAQEPWTRDDFVPPMLIESATCHGGMDGANQAFLRADSVLLVLFAGPVDDCSTPERAFFARDAELNYSSAERCTEQPDRRYPIDRYVDGLLGLRRSPSRLVVAAIAGIPDGVPETDYDAILADSRMVEVQDPTTHSGLQAVCFGPQGYAWPGRRFVRLLRDLDRAGATTVLHSSCSDDPEVIGRLFDGVQAARAGR